VCECVCECVSEGVDHLCVQCTRSELPLLTAERIMPGVQYSTGSASAVQCSAVQCSAVQCSAVK
jgi:hypothetical protein